MSNDTYTATELATIELEFVRHIAGLGGWLMGNPYNLYEPERRVLDTWIADGRVRRATRDGWDVVELTAAGWAWCHENGIGS